MPPWFADPSPEGQERDRRLRVVPEVELNAANSDLKVQVLQSSERRGPGEDARREFTWVTDLSVRPNHASELARAARSRWKIENEVFNTLKNVQYLEHNFGHGSQHHLSNTFAALMLLAFLIDQVLAMTCPVMKRIFAKCYTRTATWERLCSSFCAVAFRNLAGTVRSRHRDLHRVHRLRYDLTADHFPRSMKIGTSRGPMPP